MSESKKPRARKRAEKKVDPQPVEVNQVRLQPERPASTVAGFHAKVAESYRKAGLEPPAPGFVRLDTWTTKDDEFIEAWMAHLFAQSVSDGTLFRMVYRDISNEVARNIPILRMALGVAPTDIEKILLGSYRACRRTAEKYSHLKDKCFTGVGNGLLSVQKTFTNILYRRH